MKRYSENDSVPSDPELADVLDGEFGEFEWAPIPRPPKPERVFQTEPIRLATVPPGFFVLTDFLCDRVGVPHKTLVDYAGFRDALSGRKPGSTKPKSPKRKKPGKKPAKKRYDNEGRSKQIPDGRKAT